MRNKHKSPQVPMNVNRLKNLWTRDSQSWCKKKYTHRHDDITQHCLKDSPVTFHCSSNKLQNSEDPQSSTTIWPCIISYLSPSCPLPLVCCSFAFFSTFACTDLPIPYLLYITESFSFTRSHNKLYSLRKIFFDFHATQTPLLYISKTNVHFLHNTYLNL